LHQVREWQRRCRAGVEKLAEGFTRDFAVQLFAGKSRSVAEGAAFGLARQQILLKETVESSHDRGVSQIWTGGFHQIADGSVPTLPKSLKQAFFEWPQLGR